MSLLALRKLTVIVGKKRDTHICLHLQHICDVGNEQAQLIRKMISLTQVISNLENLKILDIRKNRIELTNNVVSFIQQYNLSIFVSILPLFKFTFVKTIQLVSRQTKVGFDRRLINNVYLLSLHLQVLILTQMIASDLPFDIQKLFLC